ncbi:hydroxymethylglutaryl-CoA lyase [uncultured Paracoccus sp.]|uniref:hydroxymethylglutaryl-CoA lyase n=1 Tax=uncultured Paracoccus sp. TaxID=189685 RepID=UPI002639F1A8|nr:hydroxymethylglutaryl-CoA lyase [uncultured Paracoccus sp.]
MTNLNVPSNVRIVEVGPRDGLQNEPENLPTAQKIELIRRLAAAGLTEIEVTSFTHPKWIPNLADAETVTREIADLSVISFALVPNRRGLERALASGAKGVTLVLSASESHNKANLNRSTAESLDELVMLESDARQAGLKTRISLSVVFGCPFEGEVPPDRVAEIVARFVEAGSTRIGLCDTIGVANPQQVFAVSRKLRERFSTTEFELHLHDTRGQALANTLAGLQAGIVSFDSSIGGLGGCPYAPGATGNAATEDVASMLHAMGIHTGVDETRLLFAASLIADWRERPLDSAAWRVSAAGRTAATVNGCNAMERRETT